MNDRSFSIDWLANEMSGNPSLARAILHRLVDTNKNGHVTAREMQNPSGISSGQSPSSSSYTSLSSSSSQLEQNDSEPNEIFLN